MIRAVTLQPATGTVAGIFVTGKVQPGKLCVCVPDTAVTGCCSRAAALIFTVCRRYWEILGGGQISAWTEKQGREELAWSVGTGLKSLLGRCALNACR